jgi:hypothetical protein
MSPKERHSVGKRSKILQWGLPILGIVIACGLCGVGGNEKPILVQTISEPATNTGGDLKVGRTGPSEAERRIYT